MILWFMKLIKTLSSYASLFVNYFLSLLVFEIMSYQVYYLAKIFVINY